MIKNLACGHSHTLLLAQSGELFAMGHNGKGQLGLADKHLEFSTAPLLIQELKNLKVTIKQIACGAFHNLLLSRDGKVFSWGSNSFGECGHTLHPSNDIFQPLLMTTPIL